MNCRQSQHLLSLERDNQLPAESRSALDGHLAGCGDCRQHRDELAAAAAAWKTNSARIETPDAKGEWNLLRARLARPDRVTVKRGIPAWGWFAGLGLPAALACLALFLVINQPISDAVESVQMAQAPARAEYVELGDDSASPVIYVDQQSGWLIVWAEGA